MSDPLATLLAAEADRRVAGQGVPPLDAVRVRRVAPRRRSAFRTAAPLFAAAASVVAVVLVAGQLQPSGQMPAENPAATSTFRPGDPELGTIAPPPELVDLWRELRPRSEEPAPLPAKVDILARVQLQGASEALLVGFVSGDQRCLNQFAQGPDARGSYSTSCQAAADPVQIAAIGGPAINVSREAGARKTATLRALLPAETETLRLSAPGVETREVPAYASGSRWGGATYSLASWPIDLPTQLLALDASGTVIARAMSTPGVPSEISDFIPVVEAGDPELGTIPTPRRLDRSFTPDRSQVPGLSRDPKPERVDVLARVSIADDSTAWLVGYSGATQRCTFLYVVDATNPNGGGGLDGCGATGLDEVSNDASSLSLQRVGSGPGEDPDQTQLLFTGLPPGTKHLRLSASGGRTLTVPAFAGGKRWADRSYALASWPRTLETRGEALAADGSVLATTS